MQPRGHARPLLVGDGWFPDQTGGLTRYLADLYHALSVDGGTPPEAVLLGPIAALPQRIDAPAGLSDPLPRRLWRLARAVSKRVDDDTVLDCHFALNAFVPVVLGRARRIPLVVHFQGPWADESLATAPRAPGSRWLRAAIEGAVYRRAHTVVTLSSAFRELVVERYRVDPWKVLVLPPGVDLDRFAPGDRSEARRRLGIDPRAFLVVAVRRLVPRMGLDDLIRAAAVVPGVGVRIVGDGPERTRLATLIRELDVGDRVSLVGPLDDDALVDHYRAADLTVIPTLSMEGFGLVALESLATGTPVVASECDGLTDALGPLSVGHMYRPGDPSALASHLERACADPGSLPSAETCRDHAARHRWSDVAEKHRAVYARAATDEASDRLRVLYLDHTAAPSGAELALLRLLPALGDGVNAQVMVGDDGPFPNLLRTNGHAVQVLPIGRALGGLRRASLSRLPIAPLAAFVTYVIRLARFLRRTKPDLVHTNTLKAAVLGGIAGRLARVPVVWHMHDRITTDYLPSRAARAVRFAARHLPSGVIANSETTKATLGELRSPVRAIPCALDPTITPSPQGSHGPGLRFGLVGRLARWKGQDVFLRAFSEAFPTGPHEAVLIGADLFDDQEWAEAIDQLIVDLGLESRVDRRGHCDDMAAEYRQLNALVHASTLPEPFGQVVTEGLAAGLPVIAVGEGGPAEIIDSPDIALTYPMGDHHALADLMRRVADDPELRASLAAAGPEAAQPYASDLVASQVLDFYGEVLGRSSR